jgi:uncharacterized protein
MKSTQVTGGYLLVLKPGEKVVESIKQFCQERIIRGGWLSGLGAVSEAEIGYYNLSKQQYHFVKLDSPLEVVSLTGNIAYFQNEVFLHIHTVLSDEGMKTYGGHLQEAKVNATLEIMLRVFDTALERKLDNATGLKIIS